MTNTVQYNVFDCEEGDCYKTVDFATVASRSMVTKINKCFIDAATYRC